MNHRRWLGKEVSKWIDEKIINKDTGDIILSRYKKEYRQWVLDRTYSGSAFSSFDVVTGSIGDYDDCSCNFR